jgi:hypothetical protein
VSFGGLSPLLVSSGDFATSTTPVVALFSADLDTTVSGQVCTSAHLANNATAIDTYILNLTNLIIQIHKDGNFVADVVLVYTLDHAAPYGYRLTMYSITAQLVIAANRVATYAMFLYEDIKLPLDLAVNGVGATQCGQTLIIPPSTTNDNARQLDKTSNISELMLQSLHSLQSLILGLH